MRESAESFTVTTGPVTVLVESKVAGLEAATRRLTMPIFNVSRSSAGDAPHVRIFVRHSPEDRLPTSSPRNPVLMLDETRAEITSWRHGHVQVLYQPGDAVNPILLQAVHKRAEISVTLMDRDLRPCVRLIKSLLGALAQHAGAIFVHAAAIALNGRGCLIAAESGGGKSSLSFLASTISGWSFLSEDLVYLSSQATDSFAVSVHGWPHRAALSTSLLAQHPAGETLRRVPLRRHPQHRPVMEGRPPDWGVASRRRIYLDLDELADHCGISIAGSAGLAGAIFPRPVQDMVGWHVSQRRTTLAELVAANGATTENLKFLTDFLGLVPADAVTSDHRPCLSIPVPAVDLVYGPDVNERGSQFWAEVVNHLWGPT